MFHIRLNGNLSTHFYKTKLTSGWYDEGLGLSYDIMIDNIIRYAKTCVTLKM